MAAGITFHRWLTAAGAHRSQVSHNCYFQQKQKVAGGTQTKARRSLWSLSVCFASVSPSAGTPAGCLASLSFIHLLFLCSPAWLQHFRGKGDILTLLIFQRRPSSLSGFSLFSSALKGWMRFLFLEHSFTLYKLSMLYKWLGHLPIANSFQSSPLCCSILQRWEDKVCSKGECRLPGSDNISSSPLWSEQPSPRGGC